MADVYLKVGDRLPALEDTLTDGDGNAIDLTDKTVRWNMRMVGGGVLLGGDADVTSATEGLVSYSWRAVDTEAAGNYTGEWEVTDEDDKVETFPKFGYRSIVISDDLG